MADELLTWEITPTEKRTRTGKFISRSWLILVGLVVFSLFYHTNDFTSWLLREGLKPALTKVFGVIIGVSICIWLFFLLNKFLPYKKRVYQLNNAGIKIVEGKKKRHFSWNEFECFYPYRLYQSSPKDQRRPGETTKAEFLKVGQQAEGRIFYLKKKSKGLLSRFFKTFIVVRSEPNNSKTVMKFLSKHLSQKRMTSGTDLGLVFYQFK